MNGTEMGLTETPEMNRGGRPRLPVDADAVAQLRTAGRSWRAIARQLGVGYGTVRRACQERAKTEPKPIPGPCAMNPKQEMPIPIPEPFHFHPGFKRWRWRNRLVQLPH